ncbi:MAG TPA: DUF2934 domain-containing protein [Candidatus Eisenbacteria bacterium]|nr:DUF2934 domain-containing protein [Candidatus Eisenbacteria bacterium]
MKPVMQMPNVNVNKKSNAAESSDLQERIRVRAYELFEQRGCEPGHELEDWLQAKAEVETDVVAA